MFKLIKLEMRKFRLSGLIKGVLLANLIILFFLLLIGYGEKYTGEIAFSGYQMAFGLIDNLVRLTFMIYASVLMGTIVIEEYKNKTITVLFLYPVSRKKIITAKLIIVAVFAFVSIIFSVLFIGGCLLLADSFNDLIPGTLEIGILTKELSRTAANAFAAAGISLIPLYFGMRKKSVSTTIVSGVIIASIICSNSNGFSLSSIIAIPMSLAAIGILIAYLGMRNIEHTDVV